MKFNKRTHSTRYSEVHTWASCRMKWYWSYHLNLEPKYVSDTIRRGVLGHVALATLDQGGDVRRAVYHESRKYVVAVTFDGVTLADDSKSLDHLLTSVIDQTEMYDSFYARWNRVLAVEQKMVFKVQGVQLPFNFTIDAIVEDRYGLWVVERKWVDQFRSPEMFDLDSQFSIYTMGARAMGFPVKGVIVDQVGPMPAWPKLNKDGTVSKAYRGDQLTLDRWHMLSGVNRSASADLETPPLNKQFERYVVQRSDKSNMAFIEDLKPKVSSMKSVNKDIYMTDDRIRCKTCQFRELCIEKMRGRTEQDIQDLISMKFRTKEPQYNGN